MNHRAYSLLDIKSVDGERRIIRGTATTPAVDRMGDVIEPLGVSFKNPLPLLLYHDSRQPVGTVTFEKPTAKGIEFQAHIPSIDEPPSLKDRVDTAWASVKAGLLKGVSVGFRSLEESFNKETDGFRFIKTEVLELSLVSIPANQQASIHTLKQFDTTAPAASGIKRSVTSTPGVSGQRPNGTAMNVSEALTAERNSLQIKSARLQELMTNDQTDGGLDETETKELETLTGEVDVITAKVKKLTTLEAAQASMAGAVVSVPAQASKTSATRTGVEVVPRPKGQIFVRYAMAVAAGKGSRADTLEYARRFGPDVVNFIKATEGVATLNSPSWGSELVNPNTAATEFVELLNPATIIGRVQGFRNVMFNIPIITQTGASTFEWVDEGAEKPVGELAFDRTTLTNSKVSGIIVLSDELVRLSDPKAEAIVRQDLVEQCAKFLDEQFIHVGVTAGTSSPASITNGVASPSATGVTAAALLHDLNIALATFDNNSEGLVIVTTPAIARGISLLLTTLGNRQFPEMTPNGGSLLGYPVIVSSSVESGVVVIFKPSDILLADDGRVTLDSSNQATLNMNAGSPGTATFSLWQRNCTAIRAERWIKWQKRRANVVAVIDTAAYAPA
jgi:HK97 family phage major capsid protein/HK97 family phage prohead protease